MRRLILDAAGVLLAEKGYELVTVRGIADRISYSQGVIFYHFRNKSEILEALCREAFTELLDRFRLILDSPGEPSAKLQAAARAFIAFSRAHPHHFRIVFHPPAQLDDQSSVEYLGRLGSEAFELFGVIFRAAHPGCESRPMAEVAWWGSVIGVTSFLVLHRDSAWVDAEAVIEELLAMLASPSALP